LRIALIGNNTADVVSLSRYIEKKHGFTRMSMLDGVRKTVRSLYFYKGYSATQWEAQNNFYDALYKIDPNIWTKYLEYRLSKTDKNVVITHIRYSQEAKRLNELGFIIIRISSPKKEVARSLAIKRRGQDPADGTLLIQETFIQKNTPYKVEYSIYNDNKDNTKEQLDKIIANEV